MENGNDIASIISKIIENQEFTEMVSELRGSDPDSTSKELKANLPSVLDMVSPLLTGASANSVESERPDSETQVGSKAAVTPKKYDKDRAGKLMLAIKPYLRPERCRIIDSCVSLMQLGDAADLLGALRGIAAVSDKGSKADSK